MTIPGNLLDDFQQSQDRKSLGVQVPDNLIADYQRPDRAQSMSQSIRQALLNGVGAAFGPIGSSVMGGLTNQPLSPGDVMVNGLTQGWEDKATAAIKGLGALGSGEPFSDTYKMALAELVQRRQQGMAQYGTAGKVAETAASVVPYLMGGGAIEAGASRLVGKLGASALAAGAASSLQAAGSAESGQEGEAAKGAFLPGVGAGLVLGGAANLIGGAATRAIGPINYEQAGIQWLKRTGAFTRDIEVYERQAANRLAKLPEGAPLTLAQLGEEKLTQDALKKMASKSPTATKMFEQAADEHSVMADPYYTSAYKQSVALNGTQAATLANEPAAQVAWRKATQEFPGLPAPSEGAQVPVKAMDYIKRELDGAVNSTKDYVERDNLKVLRDALIKPVKDDVPDYAKATAISAVGQTLKAAVLVGKKAQTSGAVRGVSFPSPVPEAVVGAFMHLMHANPAYAAGMYGLRLAASAARHTAGWAAERGINAGASLLLENPATALPKLAAPSVAPTLAIPAAAGAIGGSLGVQYAPDQP